MSTELAKIEITADQRALIKKTIAQGATDDELQLFFYDCQRRGIHPLDKLIHFTKRAGKYTPVTSIDLMRTRAADSGEYAGNDDAVFTFGDDPKYPQSAVVTVWRLVAGVRCPFTATARWSEYVPQDAFMWKKMPCTMLAKCAEALALRKAFPGQLSGLYAKEEMDQASNEPKMAPQDAQAFVANTMAALKTHTTLPPKNDPPIPAHEIKELNAMAIAAQQIPQESQENHVPYEEVDNVATFTVFGGGNKGVCVEQRTARNGNPYRKVFWREGSGLCYEASEFAVLDALGVGDVISVKIEKNDKGWISIKRVLEVEGAKPQYDDSALFVSEGEGVPF